VLRAQYKADHSGVAPILAVALDPETQLIDGILLPLYGESLESFLEHRQCGLRLSHIYSLLEKFQDLQRLSIFHGDIRDWNILVEVEKSGDEGLREDSYRRSCHGAGI
jgi:hypothetical protein